LTLENEEWRLSRPRAARLFAPNQKYFSCVLLADGALNTNR